MVIEIFWGMKYEILTPFHCWDPDARGGEKRAGVSADLLASNVNALSHSARINIFLFKGNLAVYDKNRAEVASPIRKKIMPNSST